VKSVSEDIIKLWAELGTPQAQTDVEIIKHYRDSPEQLGLHESDIAKLRGKHDKLIEEKKGRERRLNHLKTTVEDLWNRLAVEERDRKAFLAANRGCGLRTINEFEDELARLNELKQQNLHLFVEDARCQLQQLWDGLYFSEEEMLDFTPAFSDVYSDALLSAHEAEIERLQTLREQRAPTLNMIDKHRSLIQDRENLAASSNDASRLLGRGVKGEKRDPTRLLREEKMRKRIAKDLPKIEVELKKVLEHWEDEYGRPFLVHGERYLDEIAASQARAPQPRSKTPSGPAPTSKSTLVPLKPAAPSRPGSSMRGPPPPRSMTKTPTRGDTIKRNPLATSTSRVPLKSPTKTSPSKIPSRVPLSNMPHGNNSPERNQRLAANTSRLMGPPRAPPPKMRDLFVPPKDQTPMLGYQHQQESAPRPPSSLSSGSSNAIVRPMSPEDVYDDRHIAASMSSNSLRSLPENTAQSYHDYHPQSQSQQHSDASYYPQSYTSSHPSLHSSLAGSRQISNSSSAGNTAASGSENWESYDDPSEPEPDASDAYYAKMKAAGAKGKRMHPEAGMYGSGTIGASQGKKFRGLMAHGGRGETMVEGIGGRRIVEGSEAGWTDEDAF
jgi:protein regulator of cytokinesis 1